MRKKKKKSKTIRSSFCTNFIFEPIHFFGEKNGKSKMIASSFCTFFFFVFDDGGV